MKKTVAIPSDLSNLTDEEISLLGYGDQPMNKDEIDQRIDEEIEVNSVEIKEQKPTIEKRLEELEKQIEILKGI